MLATGIVRRIDDLGRVVIPRDIRKQMHIHENEPLEIFVDRVEGSVIFKPYKMVKEPWEILYDLVEDIEDTEEYHPFKNRLQQLARDMKKAASN